MNTHRAAAVLGTAALALVPLLSACGGGSDAPTGSAPAGRTSPTPAGSAPADGDAAAGSATRRSSPGTGQRPKAVVPDDELTPATGTFTTTDKRYLRGRVPMGTDPAAILQTGQETCDRLRRVAKADRDAAVGAIIAGEIKGAQGAVEHLCTDLKPLLAETRGGLADGTHSSPAAGRYRALTATGDACSWQLDARSGTKTTVTIPHGAKSFSSSGCYAWTRR
jgi:hypothetical protein